MSKRILIFLLFTFMPIVFQNLGVCQSQRLGFNSLEAADRSDAEGVKEQDAGAGKNQISKYDGHSSLLASKTSIEAITGLPAKEWIQSGDRWTFQNRFEEKRSLIFPILEEMGLFQSVVAQRDHYDGALLLGALHATMKTRIDFLIEEWNRGVRFDKVILLTGQRPLHTEKEKEFLHLETETRLMVWLWEHAEMDEELRTLPVIVIDAPALPDRGRPTTACTVQAYLEKHPEPLTLLAVSSQPYVGYQEAVLTHLFPADFVIEAIGEEGGRTLPLSVLLDTLGKEAVWKAKAHD